MLTRRGFAGCAICGLTGLVATDALAEQGPSPSTTTGISRKVLAQTDGPVPGYVIINAFVEIAAGTKVPRHTHPGVESSYVLDGEFELPVEGKGTMSLKPGDGFQVPADTPHGGGEPFKTTVKLAITYVVEKGKPLSSPA